MFQQCAKGIRGVTEALESGGLLQYKLYRYTPRNYLFHTTDRIEYWLPYNCIMDDLESLSSASTEFFILFTNMKKI